MIRFVLLSVVMFCCFGKGQAQSEVIKIKNGSFEERAHKGNNYKGIKSWFDCGRVDFLYNTPPDIHSVDTTFWGVYQAPYDGNSFLSVVVREDGSFEFLSQRIVTSMQSGMCYNFSVA